MARVKAKVLCFVDNGLRQPGDEFEYKGAFNKHLEYMDKTPDAASNSDEQVEPVVVRRPGRPRKSTVVNGNG
jgi:hypothetical protein